VLPHYFDLVGGVFEDLALELVDDYELSIKVFDQALGAKKCLGYARPFEPIGPKSGS
jgi:hypothetical protein